MNKSDIRRLVRERRQRLTSRDQRIAARQLAINAMGLRHFSAARHMALYLANDGEISPADIVSHAQQTGRHCYAPVILGNRKDSILRFAPWDGVRPWRLNRYAIPEPAVSPLRFRRPEQLDLIFLPLVAFDAAGRRLGMGGGFYDRTLMARRLRQHWRRPHLIGIAHECQRVDEVPVDDWDVPLDGILTDQGFYRL